MFPLLHIGDWAVTVYGVLVTLGYAGGAAWLLTQLRNMKAGPGEFWALGYCILLGALGGARLGYYAVEWRQFAADPGAMLGQWRTGWVFWPGLLGGMLMGWVFQQGYNRLYRPRKYLPVADYFAPALALGHTLGRLGCFAEGCCHGGHTILPWGVRFTHPACSVEESLLGVPLHPTQLLEAAGSLAFFVFFGYWALPRIRAGKLRQGTSFLGYVAAYSVLRFLIEFLRGDDRGEFLWPLLSPSQWVCLFALAGAGVALYYRGLRVRNPKLESIYLA